MRRANKLSIFSIMLLSLSLSGCFLTTSLDTPNKRLAAAAIQYEAALDIFITLRNVGVVPDQDVEMWAERFDKAATALEIWRLDPRDLNLEKDATAALTGVSVALDILKTLLIESETNNANFYYYCRGGSRCAYEDASYFQNAYGTG